MRQIPALKPLAQTIGALFLGLSAGASHALETTAPEVEIIGTTPLPGLGMAREHIPAAVQSVSSRELKESTSADISDHLNRKLASVVVNDVQGNPFMGDLNYRGYTASPLLGTPQGLSVYMDGVRLNQPFGDVVMWDLIPKAAISSLTLMSGSNPLFGLNTLGGALSLTTKDGRQDAGTSLELGLGARGRASATLEHGGANDKGWDWYLLLNSFKDDGWRNDSPSRIGQAFGKLGWHNARTDAKLTYAWANSSMTGNGPQEVQMLANNWGSVFTKPDVTENRAGFLNLALSHSLSDTALLSGNVYYRTTRTSTLNGDLNEDSLGEAIYYTGQAAERNWLVGHGYAPVVESSNSRVSSNFAFAQWRCISQAGQNGEPNEKCNGLLNTTHTDQQNYGLSGQLTFLGEGKGWKHQAVVGAGYDASNIKFNQASQFGYLNADRSITPVNAWADGTQGSENAFDQRVNLDGRIRTWSIFGSDTLSLGDRWHITAAGRYNETQVKNTDNLFPYNNATTTGDQRGSLSGDHRFSRFNPALGVSFTPSSSFNAYLGYSESSRAPTSIELGCADPNFGCRLPNSMAGDPPLAQVVSKTWEAGLRGKAGRNLSWNLGAFRGDNLNDILFVANSAATGYFRNFGKTRREGIEAGLSGKADKLSFGVNLTLMKATYESAEAVGSQYNSTAAGGIIAIQPGNEIPLMPRQILKAHVDYQFRPDLSAGLELMALGSSFVRGNENNAHSANNTTTFGSGKVPGYGVMNFSATWKPTAQARIVLSITNLLDRQYYTAGQLGPYAITANGGYRNSDTMGTTFYTPGAPRMAWIGFRYSFDKPAGASN